MKNKKELSVDIYTMISMDLKEILLSERSQSLKFMIPFTKHFETTKLQRWRTDEQLPDFE